LIRSPLAAGAKVPENPGGTDVLILDRREISIMEASGLAPDGEDLMIAESEIEMRADESPESTDDLHAGFFRLYLAHQHRIRAYIITLVPNRDDADDLFQETSTVLWEKFAGFAPGTDFVAWACRVAFWKISNHRKKRAHSRIMFDDRVLSLLAERAVELTPRLDARREALQGCLGRLPERDRHLVLARHEPGGNVERAARVSGRTLQAAYKALQRIRKSLFDCVSLSLMEQVS
jgi:RNA polymerase sigma-70 factor (ECF subfamily)